MTTSKPRTETPKIEPIPAQEFILTQEEVMQACALWVIEKRRNCRFSHTRMYRIEGTPGSIRITLTDASNK